MRRLFLILIVMTAMPLAVALADPPEVGVSFGVFYNSLSPYGEWLQVGGDVYAWRPTDIHAGWRPYVNGRWIWTDDGWFWASDEPWGWATCHYGRWYYDDYYGWLWIPGYEWAPAWVEWRYGGGCIGWAPLSPYAVFSMGIGVQYYQHWVTPIHYWNFVDCRYINRPMIRDYVYRSDDNPRWIGRTRDAGNIGLEGSRVVSRGPGRNYVERAGNIRIQRTEITVNRDRVGEGFVRGPGGREQFEIYRPQITQGTVRGTTVRPSHVREIERPVSIDIRRTDIERQSFSRDARRDGRSTDEYRMRQFESDRRGAVREEQMRTPPPQPPRSREQIQQRDTRVERRAVGPGRSISRPPESRPAAPREGNAPRERTGRRR